MAKVYDKRQRLEGELFGQKLPAMLEKGREVLTVASQAERERLLRAEELRKVQELRYTLRRQGPAWGGERLAKRDFSSYLSKDLLMPRS